MSNPSNSDEEVAPLAEVEVDDMETITASVEEVTLSENTPDEQRKSASCMRSTDNDADIYYRYMKSNSKNAQSIVTEKPVDRRGRGHSRW